MIIKLEFDTEGDDGCYEQEKARRALCADDAFWALWELDQYCRNELKHGNHIEEVYKVLEIIREKIWEENLLNLWN